MRRLVWMIAITAGALALAGNPASAKMVEIGIGGGVSVPVGDTEEGFDNGFHVRGFVHTKPPVLPVGLRAALGYERFDLQGLPSGQEGTGQILSGIGNLTFGFPMGPIRPYLSAGLGVFHLKGDVEGTSESSETKFGVDVGAGLEVKLGMMKGFVEARFENAFTDEGINPALADPSSIQVVPISFGLVF